MCRKRFFYAVSSCSVSNWNSYNLMGDFNSLLSVCLKAGLGPVVQNIVSLTLSLSPEHINRLLKQIHCKNNSVFVILPFEILTNR